MKDQESNSLIETYQGILKASKQMFKLTQEPSHEEEWTEAMSALIQKRDEMMAMIEVTEKRLVSAGDDLPIQDRQKIKLIIKEIQATDEKAEKNLQKELLVVRDKIGTVRQNKVAQDAYLGNEDVSDGWFFDSKE